MELLDNIEKTSKLLLFQTNHMKLKELHTNNSDSSFSESRQQFLDSILSNAPLVIWSIDLEGRFTYSQYKVDKDAEPAERVGKSALEMYKGTEVETFLRKVLKGEIQNDIIKLDTIYYDTRVSPLYNKNQEKVGYLGISLDITQRIKTENELKKFKLVLDQLPGAVFIIDSNNNFEYLNPFFTQISGYSNEDLLHQNINEKLYHGQVPDSRKDIIKSLKAGKTWQGELLTQNKNGSMYWANTIAAPFTDEQGNSDGYIVIQQDITEQKNMLTALKEREHLHRTLIEDSLEGVVITQDFTFLFINKVFCDMIGYTMDELYNLEPTSIIAPEDRRRVTDYHRKRMQGEQVPTIYISDFIRKDGSRFTAEMNSAGLEINGKSASYITMRDITEKTKMEEALRTSEEKYRRLFEAESDAIFLIELKDGRIIEANPAASLIYGYSHNEIINLRNTDLSAEPERTLKATQEKQSFVSLRYHRRKDGTIFPVELSAGFTEFEGHEVQIITSRDISERIKMQEALTSSELKYKTLVENSQDGICIIQDGVFKYVNKSLCIMLGYKAEELTNMPEADIVVPAQRDQIMKMQKSRTQGVESVANYTLQFVRKDGRIIDIAIESSTTEFEGKTASFDTLHDITESKRIQAALIESESKYRELVETTNSIILKWNKDFQITFLNEYGLRFFGFSKEEIICKPMVGTIVPYSEALSGRNLQILMESIFENPEKYAQNINENMRKNNERVWISWNNTAIRDEKGEIIDMFSVGTDITQRKKNEEELRVTKDKLQKLNLNLEKKVKETAEKLTDVNTQLIQLQKENLQSQFEVLRQQVNPHFLFNSLNVLTSLIKLEPDLAEKFTEHLSKVYRYVLENKDNDLVDLKTELDFLDAYLFLLNIRFMDKIKVQITIDDDKKDMLILPLALQLLIENSIKHNTMSKKAPLMIELFIDKNNRLNIVNNLQERESHMASTGVGLKNIAHRYKLLELPAPEFIKTETRFVAKIPLKVKN